MAFVHISVAALEILQCYIFTVQLVSVPVFKTLNLLVLKQTKKNCYKTVKGIVHHIIRCSLNWANKKTAQIVLLI